MMGIKCAEEGANLVLNNKLFDRGMLCVPAGDNVVRLIPPLVIGTRQVDEGISILEDAVNAIQAEGA